MLYYKQLFPPFSQAPYIKSLGYSNELNIYSLNSVIHQETTSSELINNSLFI